MAGLGAMPKLGLGGPVSTGRSSLMAPVIAGLMQSGPAPRTVAQGLTQGAGKLAGAVVAGLMEKNAREKEAQANAQLRAVMGSGANLEDWQKAYDALPDEQKSPDVGNWLSQQQAGLSMQKALQAITAETEKPSVHKVGNDLYYVKPGGVASKIAGGSPELEGDAKNLQAMLGRMPTQQEMAEYKRSLTAPKYTAVHTTDAYGNQGYQIMDTSTGQVMGRGAGGGGGGGGAMPAPMGAAPMRSSGGAMPAGVGVSAPPATGGGMLPDTALALQGRAAGKAAAPQAGSAAYDAGGQPVAIPNGVRWEKPQDGRLPDGSMGSVQWDKTGRFYRVLGASVKPDKSDTTKQDAARADQAQIILDTINDAVGLIDGGKDAVLPRTGFGAVLSKVPGTDALALSKKIDTLKANVMIDKLLAMKAQSPTGASGMGQLSNQEGERLAAMMGSLDQSQSPEELKKSLANIQNQSLDFIHGKGNWRIGANRRLEVGQGLGASPAPVQAAPAAFASPGVGRTLTYNPQTRRLE